MLAATVALDIDLLTSHVLVVCRSPTAPAFAQTQLVAISIPLGWSALPLDQLQLMANSILRQHRCLARVITPIGLCSGLHIGVPIVSLWGRPIAARYVVLLVRGLDWGQGDT